MNINPEMEAKISFSDKCHVQFEEFVLARPPRACMDAKEKLTRGVNMRVEAGVSDCLHALSGYVRVVTLLGQFGELPEDFADSLQGS